ncbi:major facilitator superfamily domain-containing protein [Microdochium trichocladiopsis]|uniref:Major facilitator superfamily domain-containing protein n=1 Tax=Microdochium trichocladiopsis TaxID=1682393 RepID=A0A9P8XXN2_9PEZI|nr:major facilitator superfamily domain-containing protein [Microdochium trichocladiopsis]KAH7024723.1 major facilitator superfamily domain-containing protein [Microdochium trichocladiopsis]
MPMSLPSRRCRTGLRRRSEPPTTAGDDLESVPGPPPDGGYGWAVVLVCFNAWTGSWGILQVALFETTLRGSPASTVSFVGSLGIALSVGLGILVIRLARSWGARWTSLTGIVLYGVSCLASAEAVSNVGGLFVACGVTYGVGACLIYTMSNSLPIQWFSVRLGTANGVVKLGGGVGATVMAVVTGVLTDRLGVAWTFRVFGLASLATGVPLPFLIRERAPAKASFDIDWTLFKDPGFTCLFVSGVIGVFSIYAPPFFLPAVATSLDFGPNGVVGVVACFNACMALGRLTSGFACDFFGAINIMFLTMALNGITMFAVWSVASTLPLLFLFAVLNGIANGAFFVALPTAVGRLAGERRGAGAVSITLTGWTPGLLLGNPIAGFLIDATGAAGADSIVPYRPAIFYAGSTAVLSAMFVLAARVWADRSLTKKV